MGMCIHGGEFETCRFGCTLKKAEELRLENDLLHEFIENNRITKLQADNERLRSAITKAITNFEHLGSGGLGETLLLLLNPELGEHAIILATFMPHSGADTTLCYLRRECFDELNQALKDIQGSEVER